MEGATSLLRRYDPSRLLSSIKGIPPSSTAEGEEDGEGAILPNPTPAKVPLVRSRIGGRKEVEYREEEDGERKGVSLIQVRKGFLLRGDLPTPTQPPTNHLPNKEGQRRKRPREEVVGVKVEENCLVSHTLQLLRHKRDLERRVELVEEEGLVHKVEPLPKLRRREEKKTPLSTPNIPLLPAQAKQLIQDRLPILLAHGGFTHSSLQGLEVLSDVLEDFYRRMASRLKQVREMEMSGAEQEFPDPLERVLVEMGLGGVRGLEKFYTTRLLDFRRRMEEQCVYLRKLYAHKIKVKVGQCGGLSSTPGNSVLLEILSGLEDPGSSSHLMEQEERLMRPPGTISEPKTSTSASAPPKSSPQLPKFPILDRKQELPASMVSINLNNNVDLAGFVPITSSAASRTPTLNVSKGVMTGGSEDSKAKLKEALNQRNLLRLNFEQAPSTSDATTVLLSSSASPGPSKPNASPLNQPRLKL